MPRGSGESIMARIVMLIAVMATAILTFGVTFAAAKTTHATNNTNIRLASGNIDPAPEGRTRTAATPSPGDPVLVGAGDIADCSSLGDEATAALLGGISGTVFTTGDNAYDTGTSDEFANCYNPSWGQFKARTKPTVGNHEYETPGASGYFGYFGAAAGDPLKSYYSYDLGGWHVISLNSMCEEVGGCGPDSPMVDWLEQDLAANPSSCTLAYFHHPLFSSGENGNDLTMKPSWDALYAAGAEVVLNGHDHDYERFAPQTPDGVADPAQGIREFVVGTGGKSHRPFGAVQLNSEVRNADTYGVLKLTLHPESYDWQFVPEAGKTFTDFGTDECHSPTTPPTTPPTIPPTTPPTVPPTTPPTTPPTIPPTASPTTPPTIPPTTPPTIPPTPSPSPSSTPSPAPEPQDRDKGPLAGGVAVGKDVLVPGDVIDVLPDGTRVVGIDQIVIKTENCQLTAHGDELTITMSDQGVPFRIRDAQNADISIRPDGTIVANGRRTLGDDFPPGLRDNPDRLIVPIPVDPENDQFAREPNSRFPIISSTGIEGQGCRVVEGANAGNAADNGSMDNGGDTSSKNDVIPDTTSDKPLPDTGDVPLFAAIVFGLILAGAVLSISAFQPVSTSARRRPTRDRRPPTG
jgi:hypothetical protein